LTPTRTPFQSPTPTANLGCDRIEFVKDVTVPDNSVFSPQSQFTKVWRLKNKGTCTWTKNYRVVLASGELMGGQNNIPLPAEVAPGQTIDITMNFVAPLFEKDYRGNWLIRNEKGELFGTTPTANKPFWVAIKVKSPALTGTVYDFAVNACSAQWFSSTGTLLCPGKDKDASGFILAQSRPKLEDGTTSFSPSLLLVPENTGNGYIRAVYPSFKVQNGDRFQTLVGCEFGATSCGVLVRVDYQLADGLIRDFWAFGEQYDGKYFAVDLDLSSLAGQDVKFVITVLSLGDASGDRTVWVQPRITRNPR
jgi:hypothetical protein